MRTMILVLTVFALAACSSPGARVIPTATPQPTASPTIAPTAMPTTAPTSAHVRIGVGAWVNPSPADGGPTTIDALEAAIGRTLDYALHYGSFASAFPSPPEKDDLAHGRIPILSITCGSPTTLLGGGYDSEIDTLATSIGSFGETVEMRYCDEMNLPHNNLTPSQFIPMWQYVHDRFVADGVANVRWFWCPSNENADPSSGVAYYPGDAYVDDAGYDAYDDNSVGFEVLMDTIYPSYAPIGKPMIVGETGAMRSTNQGTYLGDDAASLIRSRYPLIHALVYFDADPPGAIGDWDLSQAGLASFRLFAQAAE
jgi:endoglucanase